MMVSCCYTQRSSVSINVGCFGTDNGTNCCIYACHRSTMGSCALLKPPRHRATTAWVMKWHSMPSGPNAAAKSTDNRVGSRCRRPAGTCCLLQGLTHTACFTTDCLDCDSVEHRDSMPADRDLDGMGITCAACSASCSAHRPGTPTAPRRG